MSLLSGNFNFLPKNSRLISQGLLRKPLEEQLEKSKETEEVKQSEETKAPEQQEVVISKSSWSTAQIQEAGFTLPNKYFIGVYGGYYKFNAEEISKDFPDKNILSPADLMTAINEKKAADNKDYVKIEPTNIKIDFDVINELNKKELKTLDEVEVPLSVTEETDVSEETPNADADVTETDNTKDSIFDKIDTNIKPLHDKEYLTAKERASHYQDNIENLGDDREAVAQYINKERSVINDAIKALQEKLNNLEAPVDRPRADFSSEIEYNFAHIKYQREQQDFNKEYERLQKEIDELNAQDKLLDDKLKELDAKRNEQKKPGDFAKDTIEKSIEIFSNKNDVDEEYLTVKERINHHQEDIEKMGDDREAVAQYINKERSVIWDAVAALQSKLDNSIVPTPPSERDYSTKEEYSKEYEKFIIKMNDYNKECERLQKEIDELNAYDKLLENTRKTLDAERDELKKLGDFAKDTIEKSIEIFRNNEEDADSDKQKTLQDMLIGLSKRMNDVDYKRNVIEQQKMLVENEMKSTTDEQRINELKERHNELENEYKRLDAEFNALNKEYEHVKIQLQENIDKKSKAFEG